MSRTDPTGYNLSAYRYDLPSHLIAEEPITPRDKARLLVIDRQTGRFDDRLVSDLPLILEPGDSLVCNDTKVVPARLLGRRPGGGEAEFLLVAPSLDPFVWEAMSRPGKKLRPGMIIPIADGLSVEVLATLVSGNKRVRLHCEGDVYQTLETFGHIPLPHYIRGGEDKARDRENYQTVFAKERGAAAAPTAGLHFTQQLLDTLASKQVSMTTVTLHVGPGTFRPVQVEDIRQHKMHIERYNVSEEAAASLNAPTKGRRVCVGTTCCRVLETAADQSGKITPGAGETDIFIYPGYQFKYVTHLMTNFHWSESSLLMLVSAFAGRDLIMEAYHHAIKEGYRFYSYGDAMLIL